ncbi:MAG: dockerin type I repeat-containing protein [Prevotella sp.]|nr:dockerin type I repeat-containing protein [Alistipes senegalensis]MCM1358565.1 dockerin type I repeat-containing protein [Prevotella sp.]MCM1473907.1 dockerin type I repeat-containing protein [Muribaculaceae bacterium]
MKKIVSALMAVSICVSALPMSVCAANNIDNTDVELLEFTQKFRDEYLLDPNESEINRLVTNMTKGFFDGDVAYETKYGRTPHDAFLGVKKEDGRYSYYQMKIVNPEDEPFFNDNSIKIVQYIDKVAYLSPMNYLDNPYITEKEYEALDYDELIMTYEKLYEETGISIVDWGNAEIFYRLYVDIDGKGYNMSGEEIDIVDGKIVTVYNNIPDNADVLTTETLKGDANEDGKVSVADAVLIMQALSNPDDYKLTEQGALNADYNGDGGVTTADALEIQMIDIS